MDLEGVKENIQPLATGRDASILQAAFNSDSQCDLVKQRESLEQMILSYTGDDPLEPWFHYIEWIEQSYPSGGNESGLKKVLLKCLEYFESDLRYKQDKRLVRIYIKYIDTEDNPEELYQQLYNSGIGTMVSDFYICWAYYYDLKGNFKKADSIFRLGIKVGAEPVEELDRAHKHFGFTMSQRILYQDEDSKEEFLNSLKERRQALTSLRSHKKIVGSIRTGSAIKNVQPGKVKTTEKFDNNENTPVQVQVFEDKNNVNIFDPTRANQSVVQNIIDSTRKQENMREPGPWSKACMKRKGILFKHHENQSSDLGFQILDENVALEKFVSPIDCDLKNFEKGIILPTNFAHKNIPQSDWRIETVQDSDPQQNALPAYRKNYHYPKPNHEFSLEEFLTYRWFIKRSITNCLTQKYDKFWSNDFSIGTRLYPNFACKSSHNSKDKHILSEVNYSLPENTKLCGISISDIYPENDEEKQFEQNLYKKWKSGKRRLVFNANETIRVEEAIDETVCQYDIVGRKSIFPSRKSMAPSHPRMSIWKKTTEEDIYTSTNQVVSVCSDASNISSHSSQNCGTMSKDCKTNHASRKSIVSSQTELRVKNNDQKIVTDNLKIAYQENEIKRNDNTVQSQNFYESPQRTIASSLLKTPNKQVTDVENPGNNFFAASIIDQNFKLQTDNFNNISPLKESKVVIFEEIDKENLPLKPRIETSWPNDAANDSFTFKTPALPKPFTKPKIDIYIDEEVSLIGSEGGGVFCENETCSTQTFNMFVKEQAASTPVNMKKQVALLNPKVKKISFAPLEDTNFDNEKKDKFVTVSENVTNQEIVNDQLTTLPQKQLSTIMETSETNTASTKSSVDAHLSINNFDTELSHNVGKSLDKITLKENANNHINTVDFSQANNVNDVSPTFLRKKTDSWTVYRSEHFPNFKDQNDESLRKLDNTGEIKIFEDQSESVTKFEGWKKMFDNKSENLSNVRNKSWHFEKDTKDCSEGKVNQNTENETKRFVVEDSLNFSKFQNLSLSGYKCKPETKKYEMNDTCSKFKYENCVNFEMDKSEKRNDDIYVESILMESPTLPDLKEFIFQDEPDVKNAEKMTDLKLEKFSFLNDTQPGKSILKKKVFEPEKETSLMLNFFKSSPQKQPNNDSIFSERQFKSKLNIFGDNTKNVDKIQVHEVKKISIDLSIFEMPDLHKKSIQSINKLQMENSNLTSKNEKLEIVQCNDSIASKKEIGSEENQKYSNEEKFESNKVVIVSDEEIIDEDLGRTIYLDTSSSPKFTKHNWSDDKFEDADLKENFIHPNFNYDQTCQNINEQLSLDNLNPFSLELIGAFLDNIEFSLFLQSLKSCELRKNIPALKSSSKFIINDQNFHVEKIIGEGSYGRIFSVQNLETGKNYALKQEKPANLWEYYICLELRSRINNTNILNGFMEVSWALIGNNASILISELSIYGSLITVCNKVKQFTQKNVDELVVMVLVSQILSIIDNLHAALVIHADIKPDNFLLMNKLSLGSSIPSIQLIDFGVAIDLQQFPKGQKFKYVNENPDFQCVEMRENLHWRFQPDLFGVAGTIHVLLFGKYMDIVKNPSKIWMPKQHFPRYFNKNLWIKIFHDLLNIRDCDCMPNLQELRKILEEEIVSKERFVNDKINEFNKAINS